MSVVIKGMDKPKNCFGCNFNMYDCYCKINHGGIDRDFWDCENPCPIVEVPVPHGRIADMDEVIKCIEEVKGKDAEFAICLIEWACGKRTIVEAEEDGE
jgi:hypothetical protein